MGKLDKYGKEDKPVTDEELDLLAKRGGAASAIMIPTGAVMTAVGLSKLKDKNINKTIKKYIPFTDREIKYTHKNVLAAAGIGSLAVGSALAGYSAYRHHKNKKKEEHKDDNSKN